MSASLVGSEMCIRDSCKQFAAVSGSFERCRTVSCASSPGMLPPPRTPSVSYTHLTLPTICSV
eukprot:6056492-Alexandrium_andersonii.AAC.1